MTLGPYDRLYAIGDIHGRIDLLDRLYQEIRADAAKAPPGRRLVVHLGDYVDRGHDSRGVIERVMAPGLAGFETVALLGNHDLMMREFLVDPIAAGPGWLHNGAAATLESYGVDPPLAFEDLPRARDALARALPPPHRAFLQNLVHYHAVPPYLFVHAGIRPGVPLERQSLDDLVWIREEFMDSEADHGFVVVHGHSILPAPELKRNRIGIDTGAWRTGRLTAAALGAGPARFLST
ncbi:MAG: metallophosphoesterase family protein [Rhodospirillales bacterium]